MNFEFDDLYGSKYLSAADLHGQQPHFKIGKVEPQELKEKDGTMKTRMVVYFEGVEKALVLNKTNAVKLAAAYSKDFALWVGMTVEAYAEMTSLGKEGIRLRPLSKPSGKSEMNDAIPF